MSEVSQAWARAARRQTIANVALAAALVGAFVAPGVDRLPFAPWAAPFATIVAFAAYTAWNIRCPACGKNPAIETAGLDRARTGGVGRKGGLFDRRACQSCGVALRD